ncbi:hypothetical protein J6590_001302 [Homalodisca vitripennis]|nr:hypothetical protein J6590_001302 [Homalodisca vitripennis]
MYHSIQLVRTVKPRQFQNVTSAATWLGPRPQYSRKCTLNAQYSTITVSLRFPPEISHICCCTIFCLITVVVCLKPPVKALIVPFSALLAR